MENPLFELETDAPSKVFEEAWNAAATHLKEMAPSETLTWARNHRFPPLREHLSFWYGNQFFFVFIEIAGETDFSDDAAECFLREAKAATAIPCRMKMHLEHDGWSPIHPNWGLIHALTEEAVQPDQMKNNKPSVMSDYECRSLALQMVHNEIMNRGWEVIEMHPYSDVEPSIFFKDESGYAWATVSVSRFPEWCEDFPPNTRLVSRAMGRQGVTKGYHVHVGLCSAYQDINSSEPYPLVRGDQIKGTTGEMLIVQPSMTTSEVKGQDPIFFEKVMMLLFEHDPAGLNFGNNYDEYSDETARLIERLPEAESQQQFEEIIIEEFEYSFCPGHAAKGKIKDASTAIWQLWLIKQQKTALTQ